MACIVSVCVLSQSKGELLSHCVKVDCNGSKTEYVIIAVQ